MKLRYVILACFIVISSGSDLYARDWLWTPESGKWISERDIEKRSARVRYEKARQLEEEGSIKQALREYARLVKLYPTSVYSPEAQYIIGLYKEADSSYYKAFKEYEKVINNYPSYKRFLEIIEREYALGNLFLSGEKAKVMGIKMLPAMDKSVEIFDHIVRKAPYSSFAPRAQFNIGEAYRKIKRYSEAIPAYNKVVVNYPESKLVMMSEYYIGICGYERSLDAKYDQTGTNISITSMKRFLKKFSRSKKAGAVRKNLDLLLERKAKKSFEVAKYYERDKCEEGAIIYYQDVINDYPGTKLAQEAENRIDHIIANPIGTGGKKSFLASIPFIKKLVQKPEEEYEERALEKDPFKKKQAAQKKKFWEFWKKSEKAVAVEQKEDAKKVKPVAVAKGKKQFWEFWKKSDAAASKDVEPVVVAKKKKQQKKQFWEIWKKTPPAETEKEEEVPNVGITGRDGALTMRELGASEEEDQISQEPTQTMTSYEDSGYLLPKKAGTEIAQASVDSEESEYIPSDEEIEAELMSNEPIRSEDFDESSIPAKDTAVSLQEEFDEVVVEKDDIPSVVKDAAQKISDGESISVEDVLEARDARTGASPASRISKVDDSIAPLMSDDYEEEVDEAAFDEEVPAEIPIEFDLAQISDLKLVESDKGKKMVFATNKAIDFVSYRLENPTRLMIAMKSPTYSSLDSVITVDAAGVKTVRSHYRTKEEGHVGWQVNAIVLDFDDNIKYKVSSNENAITIELKQ